MMCPTFLVLNFRKKDFYNALLKPHKALRIKELLAVKVFFESADFVG